MFVLYNKDGTYDTNSAIISHDAKLIKYANKLFKEIEEKNTYTYTTIPVL